MAIGSLDKAGRLQQLRDYANVQVRSGFNPPDKVQAEVLEAVLDECRDPAEAQRLTAEYISDARAALADEAATWPDYTEYDALEAAFADAEAADIVVVRACDDHWAADAELTRLAAMGRVPTGIAFFTQSDVWHAVEHKMLEINLWHGNRANVTASDGLLTHMNNIFASHGLDARFDEGRIEVSVSWQRRTWLDGVSTV